ncbi:hypothetical protein DC522_03285 [Microvirga sp. KLBC 81]|uniref:hypothetical protein n=1 Tax=Microvirga sp. KLBC 81 TaxID=1862707 RepID=UPI000D510552|nr:hypothetical protein [Microvirga sp. KLBC 81]PVE25809.1 hypothetical protein DC522_03285 [Microvirga sp. KLBC 81]
MSTGIITTAIILIICYAIISRIVGFAFRLVVPLVLIVLLGGAGVVSELMPGRAPNPYAVDQDISYGPAQRRTGGDIGDLRLRDVADMAVRAVRSLLEGSLGLLNRVSEPEPTSDLYRPIEPRHSRHGEYREGLPDEDRGWRQVDPQERW